MSIGGIDFLLILPALILALIAQGMVKSTYAKYSRIGAASRITGAQVARLLLGQGGAGDVTIEQTPGQLTDHYDPRKKVLRLSEGVFGSSSLAALGIAAHETGHALQHRERYAPLMTRNLIYPVANIGSTLAFPLFFIGLLTAGSGTSILMDIGIWLFVGAVAFTVVTLPVEFNASRRALALLKNQGYLGPQELVGAKKVLQAAAMTYVASTAMAVMQLFRLLIIRGSRD
ncbi:MAG: zinc metallopeptidase [Acidobacteriota bacterium]|nr:zinc metallopeptidase [Acidobacteriota bacterium]OQB57894.1 MAG: putative neutral zinc metallopeptidase [Candidatus Aminicenantes bacterium ADurb.Bin147]HNQ81156.1 zinc metallopeptidase [Candidatus Aminicenantes bacterium]MDD8011321.1 zinc metallopeptidase [Acidobacteriota bacterium]MDD8029772.1 zinc metallopeptidase [Acidobacteriota bacterium]